jgi:hypothetical protein
LTAEEAAQIEEILERRIAKFEKHEEIVKKDKDMERPITLKLIMHNVFGPPNSRKNRPEIYMIVKGEDGSETPATTTGTTIKEEETEDDDEEKETKKKGNLSQTYWKKMERKKVKKRKKKDKKKDKKERTMEMKMKKLKMMRKT